MASASSAQPSNPFKSIMTMLCNNKCWLCESVFARGKIKKVFMVSHLVRFLEERYALLQSESSSITDTSAGKMSNDVDLEIAVPAINSPDQPITSTMTSHSNPSELMSPNLRACFEDYCLMKGEKDKIMQRLIDIDCETWMSGLICCRTTACAAEYLLLVPGDNSVAVPKTEPKFRNGEKCPPSCDCDNPWQYVADILKRDDDTKR